jgi:putative transposase
LYFRFNLSYRDIEEMMSVRGLTHTYEAVRYWCLKFGQTYANELRRRRPRQGDKWHLDEVFITINGRVHYPWWAVDHEGEGLYILVQGRRNKKAAKRFTRLAAEGLAIRPSRDHHGSVQELQRGEGRDHAWSGAPPG